MTATNRLLILPTSSWRTSSWRTSSWRTNSTLLTLGSCTKAPPLLLGGISPVVMYFRHSIMV